MVLAIQVHDDDDDKAEDDENVEMAEIFPSSNIGTDVNDIPSRKASVTRMDIFWICWSILIHLIDVIVDFALALRYWLDNKIGYFYWTMAVLLIPSIINIMISLRMYNQEMEMNAGKEANKPQSIPNLMAHRKRCYVFIIIFQLAPVLRYLDVLKYAWKSRNYKILGDQIKQRRYYVKMLKEEQDIALLRVFECFLEAAPQQILQLTIMLKNYHIQIFNFTFLHQVASIISSLASMGWAMASYNRSIRLAQWDKSNISAMGTVLQFLWHFLITVSRIISISAVASVWMLYTGIYCSLHWLAMTIWILAEPSGVMEFCRDRRRAPHTPLTLRERIGSVMFASVFGVVYIFIYLNPSHGPTFFRHLLYYILCLVENLIACTLWAFVATTEVTARWYFELLISLCIIPFVIGSISMILYYKYFHPSAKTKRPIPQSS